MQPSEAEMVQFNYFIAKIKVQQAYKMVREAKVKKEKSGVTEAKISKWAGRKFEDQKTLNKVLNWQAAGLR